MVERASVKPLLTDVQIDEVLENAADLKDRGQIVEAAESLEALTKQLKPTQKEKKSEAYKMLTEIGRQRFEECRAQEPEHADQRQFEARLALLEKWAIYVDRYIDAQAFNLNIQNEQQLDDDIEEVLKDGQVVAAILLVDIKDFSTERQLQILDKIRNNCH